MSTAGQKAKHARAQARYKRKQAAQAKQELKAASVCFNCGGELGKFASEEFEGHWVCGSCNPAVQQNQFQEGNIKRLTHGAAAREENLPVERRDRFVATTSTDRLIRTLGVMTNASLTMLELLRDCDHPEAARFAGNYGQLVVRFEKIDGQWKGGKLKPVAFGVLSDKQSLKKQRNLARALSALVTKIKFTFQELQTLGLVEVKEIEGREIENFRRFGVHGLAGMLASSATTIEAWLAIRQWEDKKNAKTSNSYVDALRNTRRS